MKPTAKAAIALTLALLAAVPASGQSFTPSTTPISDLRVSVAPPTPAFVEQAQGPTTNPPTPVRRPSNRTRLIVAVVLFGTLAGLALVLHEYRR